MVRAALEARGVPVRIEGAAIHGVLGMLHGAALAPRVLVPSLWRSTAKAIVTDIVGPFDDDLGEASAGKTKTALPFRAEAVEQDGGDDDQADDDEADDDDIDDALVPVAPARRSFAVPLMLGMLGLPWGFGHIYARHPGPGAALMVLAGGAAAAWLAGVPFAGLALIAVGLMDIVGSMLLIARYNRALPQQV